ncbi:hypothetical protein OH76DRAFT_1402181 [Lentinus brumalis]|uniref:Uncharacterized protein n=1 Tax=Lentinus brumalis TaxID=2498619 RepID=A0A371DEL7_9APHY|nr:hypothetical protein OH76DRAFT_1402181 [Polyporus brumalis]
MGFLKRFLSLGSSKSRKNKKKQNANARVDAEGRILAERGTQDPDTSVNRLLRSSSTKFAVMSEIDYTSLPPLPPSMQDLLSTPSISPSPSLTTVATTPGVQRSGTYVVKVHGRTTHSRTEFPRANPPISPTESRFKESRARTPQEDSDDEDDEDLLDRPPKLKEVNFTPRDTGRMYKLRRDPSVASLLNLYDEKGCLNSGIFEDSPPTPAPTTSGSEGREPSERKGSTLRQLLGEPELHFALNATTEGDISWAERFLNEQLGSDSPLSSPDLETPKNTHFPDTLLNPRVEIVDTTQSSLDADSSINYPAISSMEVEVSGSEDGAPIIEVVPVSKPHLTDPKTPQRASEVFGFLSRRNTLAIKERDLPPLPQIITPDSPGTSQHAQDQHSDTSLGDHLDATHSANTSGSTQLTSSDTNSHASHAQIRTATMTKLNTAFAASTTSLNLLASQCGDSADETLATSNEVAINHTEPIPTSAHAATHATGSSLSSSGSTKAPPSSKIPRGPRPRPLSMHWRDAPEMPEATLPRAPPPAIPVLSDAVSTAQRSAPNWHKRTSSSHRRTSSSHKREALTNIPRRQHHRVTSRSSVLEDENSCERDDSVVKLSGSGYGSGASRPANPEGLPSRKRSTKPGQAAQWRTRDKENTPSPPHMSRLPVLGLSATPVHHRVLIEPPSPASSSELSPVARDMMNDLRQQRMRARQVERRRGIWVRE